jgi:sirohydrochlorin cobaltochelatase
MYEPAGADAFRSLLRLLGDRDPGRPVGGGLTAGQPLPLAESVADLVERQGVLEFVVVPLTLGRADGAEEEIRAAIRQAADRHPGTSYVRRPGALDPRPALLNALDRRLEEALGDGHRAPSDRAGTTVLLVGRGSTDPEENAELFRVARLLWEGRGYAGVEAAFVTQAAPDVPSGLDRCVRLGAVSAGRGRVVVLPYFLFEGTLPGRLRKQAEGWAEANGIEVRFAEVLGATGELADLVRDRYTGPTPDERDSGRADDAVR